MMQIVNAQKNYIGVIKDAKTGEPIPFVNIGVFEKNIGTVTNENGEFQFVIDRSKYSKLDTVQFSSIGYTAVKIAIPDLQDSLKNQKITMPPNIMELDEVVVTNKGKYRIHEVVGSSYSNPKEFGYWSKEISLGGELATRIRVKKGYRELHRLYFEVFTNPSDSVLVRVKFYNYSSLESNNGLGKRINTSGKNIYYTIRNNRYADVDLRPYEIHVINDFYVSLELVKVYGDKPIGLALAAKANATTNSLRKLASADKWYNSPNKAMSYNLSTTYFSDQRRIQRKEKKVESNEGKISGYLLTEARVLISDVKVRNLNTGVVTYSNEHGKFEVYGKKGEILYFEKNGFTTLTYKLLKSKTVNLIMSPL